MNNMKLERSKYSTLFSFVSTSHHLRTTFAPPSHHLRLMVPPYGADAERERSKYEAGTNKSCFRTEHMAANGPAKPKQKEGNGRTKKRLCRNPGG